MKTQMQTGSIAALLLISLYGTALHGQSVNAPAPSVNAAPAGSDAVSEPVPTNAVQTPAESGSQVRIVRLSEVRGEVQLDRNIDRGFEAAITNLPIVQGAKLKTTEGVAEVEFEDNSTLRLTPHTEIEFPRLGRSVSGSTASNVYVVKGIVYVSLVNTRGNEFTVSFANNKIDLPPSSHIQLYVDNPTSRLGVYEGTIQVESASGTTTVGKKKALLFDATCQAPPTLVSSIEKNPFDTWDKDAVQYHKQFAQSSTPYGSSMPQYGLADLNYYGSFADMPGCGSVWRPYFTSAGWDPYSNGIWAWYQNAAYSPDGYSQNGYSQGGYGQGGYGQGGYSWVSPYPWAWTPYHSGSWLQCASGAWGWRPGGSFIGLANSANFPSKTGPARPRLPVRPGESSLLFVNSRPLPVSKVASSDTFVFRKDSAGYGVPRQTFGNLRDASNGVARHGFANSYVYTLPGSEAVRTGPGSAYANQVASNSARSSGMNSGMAPASSSGARISGTGSYGGPGVAQGSSTLSSAGSGSRSAGGSSGGHR